MAKEVRTRQVHRDIKALDKTAAAAGHMKHAYVRTKDSAGQSRQQEHATPVEYAENKAMHGADRAANGAAHQVKKQGGKAINHVKEKRRAVKETGQIKQELREGHPSEQGECPSFSPAEEGKACQPKEQMMKNTQAQAEKQAAQQRAGQKEAQQKAMQGKAQQKVAHGRKAIMEGIPQPTP